MLVSTKHNFVWLHPPKTGGSSLTIALAPYLDDPVGPDLSVPSWQGRHHVGAMHDQYQSQFPGKPVVMFVRNPWSRVWSLCHSVANRNKLPLARFVQSLPSIEGIGSVICKPCSWTAPREKIDFVGKFEHIESDFRNIFEDLVGKESPQLTHHRTGRGVSGDYRHSDWWASYGEDTKKLVADIYRDDLEDFGYSIEETWPC